MNIWPKNYISLFTIKIMGACLICLSQKIKFGKNIFNFAPENFLYFNPKKYFLSK